MSRIGERFGKLSGAFYDRLRDPAAFDAARAQPTAPDFSALRGAKYCLLVSFRRSGEPVPTPVWFGLDAQESLYVFTDAGSGKVRRIRADPHVLVCPATMKGRPTGPLTAGLARVLPGGEQERAEQALKANYGLGRRLYDGLLTPTMRVPMVYLEVKAEAQMGAGAAPVADTGAAR